jgi:hypothetical protein
VGLVVTTLELTPHGPCVRRKLNALLVPAEVVTVTG